MTEIDLAVGKTRQQVVEEFEVGKELVGRIVVRFQLVLQPLADWEVAVEFGLAAVQIGVDFQKVVEGAGDHWKVTHQKAVGVDWNPKVAVEMGKPVLHLEQLIDRLTVGVEKSLDFDLDFDHPDPSKPD